MSAAASVKTASADSPIHEVLAERWSPYAFRDKPVSQDELRSLFEAARWARSSYNEQPWRYVVATRDDRAQFERLLSCLVEGNQAWAKHVPVLALGIVSPEIRKERQGQPCCGPRSWSGCQQSGGRGHGTRAARAPDDRDPSRQGRAKSMESRKATRHGPELRSATKVIPPRCRTISSSAT
jgi:nitroreductase